MLSELMVADSLITPPAADAPPAPTLPDLTGCIADLDDLVRDAITQLGTPAVASADQDTLLRLRLVRAHYDPTERASL